MTEWLISGAAVCAALLIFYIIGMILPPARGNGERSAAETVIAGFLLTLGAFEITCVIATWAGTGLTLFVYIWGGILCAGVAFSFVKYFGTWAKNIGWNVRHFKFRPSVLIFVLAAFAAAAFAMVSPSLAGDGFTVRRMSTDLLNDTLSTYDPETGTPLSVIQPSVLLERWPVFLEFAARLTGLKAVTCGRVCGEILTVLLSAMIIWRIFMRLFDKDTAKACCASCFALLTEIFSRTAYTPAGLLFGAGWSGEAVFANIILPAVILIALIMQDMPDAPQPFALLVFCGIGAAATCPSGILIEPLLIVACLLPEAIASRRAGHIVRMLIGLVPAAAGILICLLVPAIPV